MFFNNFMVSDKIATFPLVNEIARAHLVQLFLLRWELLGWPVSVNAASAMVLVTPYA